MNGIKENIKCYSLAFVLLLTALVASAQNPLNGSFLINGVSETPVLPTSNYSIQGIFNDPNYIYSASDIKKGDMIVDYAGLIFRIDSITNLSGNQITADVTYLSGSPITGLTYPTVFATGTLFHPTSNGYPLVTYDPVNQNENLKISVQNAAIMSIDQDISKYTSGTTADMPTDPKLGSGFYNTTEKKLYIYNGTEWMAVGSGIVPTGNGSQFPNPANPGEMFFNTDDNSIYIYSGTKWFKVSTNGSVPSGIINPDPATVTVNEGNLFYNTSDHKLYVYNGTVWMPADNILPSGQIYVGNTTNVATPVSMTGDATISNTGKLTIVQHAVTDDKLDKTHIPLSGFANPTDNVSFGDGTTNVRIINVANPTGAQDAATKNYVDALFGNPTTLLTLPTGNFFVGNVSNKAVATAKNGISLSGFGSATANISLGDGTTNYRIVNLANPTAAQDAATKNYVDTKVIDPANITLANNYLFVGNSSGKAAGVAKNTIPLSGFGAAAADISLGSFKITSLAEPSDLHDAATKNYVDTKTFDASNLSLDAGNFFVGNGSGKAASTSKSTIPLSGFGAAAADLSLGNFKITSLATPLSDNDAANKKYVDDLFATPSTGLALPSGKIFVGNGSGKAAATATTTIPVSSFGKAADNLYLGDASTQHNISYLADPLYPQDAATKNYVDSKLAGAATPALNEGFIFVGNAANDAVGVAKNLVPVSDFGSAVSDLSMGNGTNNHKITNVADPTTDQDAATKKYVDSKTSSTQSGSSLPSSPHPSDTFYSTTDNHYYVYNGTTWVPIDNTLPGGELYVGNSSNIATPTAKNAIPVSGFGAATADIELGNGTSNFRIVNLSNPIGDQDAATKKYVDSKTSSAQTGTTLPSNPQPADVFYSTTDNHYYVYNGTTWVPSDNSLPNGQLYVGNASNIATATAKNAIPVSGFGAATSDVLLGNGTSNYKISNLADPTALQDAATKKYVDSKISSTQSGSTLPSNPQPSDTFYSITDNHYYVYNGTSWIPADNSLPNGQLYVGNSSNVATATAKNAIPVSGFGAATADVQMGDGVNNFKISNLADPTSILDAVNKKYVDSKVASVPSGGTLPGSPQSANTFYSTTDNHYYVYNGTTWVPMDNTLTNGQFYVGNSSNIAESTPKSSIPLSGFGAAQTDISLGSKRIINLSEPVDNSDAATKSYVDGRMASAGDNLGNHTATQNLKMSTFTISADGGTGEGLAFDVSGNATFGENLSINGNLYTPSDERLKKNIATLSNVLQKLDGIRGVRFEYKDQKKYASGPKIGLIAQELRLIYPEMVTKGADGFYKVDYTQLTGVLVQAVKEQQQKILQQQKEIDELRNQMNRQQQQINDILNKIKP